MVWNYQSLSDRHNQVRFMLIGLSPDNHEGHHLEYLPLLVIRIVQAEVNPLIHTHLELVECRVLTHTK